MARRGQTKHNLRAVAGAALIAVGSLLMAVNLGLLAVELPHALASIGFYALDSCVAIWLAALHLLRTLLFNHTAVLSFASALLVLFFAIAAIVTGLMLLPKRAVEAA